MVGTSLTSTLARAGTALLLAAQPFALAAQIPDAASEATPPAPPAEAQPAEAQANDAPSRDSDAPAPADQPAPGLPTDAISSAANPPDDARPSDQSAPDSPPAPSAQVAALPPAPAISVTESQLLSIQTDSTGIQTIAPATSIPYQVGRSCYGWELHYAPVEGDLALSEELVLPGPARNWTPTPGDRTAVNPQGSGAITERHFDASTGTASAGWCIAKDDPVGSYRYIIRQGEREVARFDFTVGDLL